MHQIKFERRSCFKFALTSRSRRRTLDANEDVANAFKESRRRKCLCSAKVIESKIKANLELKLNKFLSQFVVVAILLSILLKALYWYTSISVSPPSQTLNAIIKTKTVS